MASTTARGGVVCLAIVVAIVAAASRPASGGKNNGSNNQSTGGGAGGGEIFEQVHDRMGATARIHPGHEELVRNILMGTDTLRANSYTLEMLGNFVALIPTSAATRDLSQNLADDLKAFSLPSTVPDDLRELVPSRLLNGLHPMGDTIQLVEDADPEELGFDYNEHRGVSQAGKRAVLKLLEPHRDQVVCLPCHRSTTDKEAPFDLRSSATELSCALKTRETTKRWMHSEDFQEQVSDDLRVIYEQSLWFRYQLAIWQRLQFYLRQKSMPPLPDAEQRAPSEWISDRVKSAPLFASIPVRIEELLRLHAAFEYSIRSNDRIVLERECEKLTDASVRMLASQLLKELKHDGAESVDCISAKQPDTNRAIQLSETALIRIRESQFQSILLGLLSAERLKLYCKLRERGYIRK